LERVDRNLGRPCLEMGAAARRDRVDVARGDEGVRATVSEVVVPEAEPPQVVEVVRRVEVPGERGTRSLARFREADAALAEWLELSISMVARDVSEPDETYGTQRWLLRRWRRKLPDRRSVCFWIVPPQTYAPICSDG
jgi:hypothetical protein